MPNAPTRPTAEQLEGIRRSFLEHYSGVATKETFIVKSDGDVDSIASDVYSRHHPKEVDLIEIEGPFSTWWERLLRRNART